MRIEHLAMYVADIENAKEFFIRYFGAKPSEKYHNSKTSFISYFLSFDDGARLEIMTRQNLVDSPKNPLQSGYAHLAISVGSKEKVDELTALLSGDGYEVVSGPRVTGDGYYESCVSGPESNLIEITI